MLQNIKTDRVLFLDIETVPMTADFESLPVEFQQFWDKKSATFRKENQTASDVYQRAGIYSEFGRIICIGFGMLHMKNDERVLRVKTFHGSDEKDILLKFKELLHKVNASGDLMLCAHNGKEFDFPYISRRMLINRIQLPAILDVAGARPWETKFIDTLELWKFGDYKHYTSLNLLTHLFGIPSPKTDIDGSQVASVFYNEKDIDRIARYCKNDVIAVAQLLLAYKGEKTINDDNIESL